MSTLREIEAAVDALPPKQREALLKDLTERPPQQQAPRKINRPTLAEFGGTVRLREETLAWQSAIRGEWQ
jgi:hypothetical protein